MKKLLAAILILTLALSMAGCIKTGVPSENPGNPVDKNKVNPNAPAQIVLDETSVQEESHYDENGICIGYYRFTDGTNCGNKGLMRLEFLDLNRTVVNTYTPKMAGTSLGYDCRGGGSVITEIWESDYKQTKTSSNSYLVYPYENGNPYVYIENRNGATVRCDLFAVNGTVVRSLTPADPNNALTVFNYEPNYFSVQEQYYVERSNGIHTCATRELTFDMEGDLLCEIAQTYVENTETMMMQVSRAEVKNPAGEVLRVYDSPGLDFELMVDYLPDTGLVDASAIKFIYDPLGFLKPFSEHFDPLTNTVLYREEKTYEGYETVSTAYWAFGGELVATKVENGNTYTKLEFYDAAGALQKCVEAQAGQLLYFRWDPTNRWIEIEIYEESGLVGSDTYCG